MFRLDFYTPRYVITREFGMNKGRLEDKENGERIRNSEERLIKLC